MFGRVAKVRGRSPARCCQTADQLQPIVPAAATPGQQRPRGRNGPFRCRAIEPLNAPSNGRQGILQPSPLNRRPQSAAGPAARPEAFGVSWVQIRKYREKKLHPWKFLSRPRTQEELDSEVDRVFAMYCTLDTTAYSVEIDQKVKGPFLLQMAFALSRHSAAAGWRSLWEGGGGRGGTAIQRERRRGRRSSPFSLGQSITVTSALRPWLDVLHVAPPDFPQVCQGRKADGQQAHDNAVGPDVPVGEEPTRIAAQTSAGAAPEGRKRWVWSVEREDVQGGR